MSLRGVAVFLGILAALLFCADRNPQARTLTSRGLAVNTMDRASFKIVTFITTAGKPIVAKDKFRLRIRGIVLNAGDKLCLRFDADTSQDVGTPGSDELTLDPTFKAVGTLSAATAPIQFIKVKAVYNPQNLTLNMNCRSGHFANLLVNWFPSFGGFNFVRPVTVTLFVNGTPTAYTAAFEIREKTRRNTGRITEKGIQLIETIGK